MPKKVIVIEDGIQKKKCTKCGELKPLDDFYFNNQRKKDGSRCRIGKCKKCFSIKMRSKYVPRNNPKGRPRKYMDDSSDDSEEKSN